MVRNGIRAGSIILAFTLLGGCASMKLENYEFSGKESTYSTDFSSADDTIELLSPTARVDDGVLHMKPVGSGEAVRINMIYGMSSMTRFHLKVTETGPELFFNMLERYTGGHTRLATILRQENTHIFAWDKGNQVYDSFSESGYLRPGTWHEIVIILHDGEYRLFVDGVLRKSLTVPPELPTEGYASFEYHYEAWVDDLEIYRFDSYLVE
ncbi:MAG: LamG-like jellyroll fold domain-containing protein [Alkalispirochaeta sp.]